MQFLDEYQRLPLAESESAVRQELKEVFIALRLAAERREIILAELIISP